MRLAGRRRGLLALAFATAACDPQHFECLQVDRGTADRVRLDQALTARFSDPVEAGSVGPASFSVVEIERGTEVHGSFLVEGESVSFLPDLPRRADLSDLALLPDHHYLWTLRGSPALSALRDTAGRRLFHGRSGEFSTVAAADDRWFVGPESPRAPELSVERCGWSDEASDRIVLWFDAAIDPRSVAELDARLFGPWDPDLEWKQRWALCPRLQFELVLNERFLARLEAALPDSLPMPVDRSVHTLAAVLDLRGLTGLTGLAVARGPEDDRREIALPFRKDAP